MNVCRAAGTTAALLLLLAPGVQRSAQPALIVEGAHSAVLETHVAPARNSRNESIRSWVMALVTFDPWPEKR